MSWQVQTPRFPEFCHARCKNVFKECSCGRNFEFKDTHGHTRKCGIQFMYYHGISRTHVIVLIFRSALQARTHTHTHTLVNSLNLERVKWDEMITVMSCCYVSMSCPVMACRHGWFFGLATLQILTMRVLQVRFHDDIDGSSLARPIYASTGPLLLPFDSGFPTHSKPLGHDFRTKKWSVIKCVVSTVLCCDMEHGAHISVYMGRGCHEWGVAFF